MFLWCECVNEGGVCVSCDGGASVGLLRCVLLTLSRSVCVCDSVFLAESGFSVISPPPAVFTLNRFLSSDSPAVLPLSRLSLSDSPAVSLCLLSSLDKKTQINPRIITTD